MSDNQREYISDSEAESFVQLFKKNLQLYKTKGENVTDRMWLEQLFRSELPDTPEEEIKRDAEEIVNAISIFDKNLASCNDAAQKGISKEEWLRNKISETSTGVSVQEYGNYLSGVDNILYTANKKIADSLSRSSDGNIMRSKNLDGNIAEHYIANTAEINAKLQGKNISVKVLESYEANSVDVRAMNHNTGQYRNYQLKFGKDAKATIALIERGNYDNQEIVVPKEQLEEIQAHFRAKGSDKTITDHIDAWGVEGKSFTKEEMKELQIEAQKNNEAPQLDYNHYNNKDLALSISKNAGLMALQAAAVTTDMNIAHKVFKGEEINADELVETAVKTGVDTSIKTVAAGTLQVAVRKGIISFIPKATPAGIIANIACVGIENVKILAKIITGEITPTNGLDQMGRVTTSMIGGFYGMAKGTAAGAALGASLAGWVPVIGPAFVVASGFIGGTVGYFLGSETGNALYDATKKVASGVKAVAKKAWEGAKSAAEALAFKAKNALNLIFG